MARRAKQFHYAVHGSLYVRPRGKMPEALAARDLPAALPRGLRQPPAGRNFFPREKKRLVVLAEPREIGHARRQAVVLRDLARAHVVEPHHFDAGLLRRLFQRRTGFRVGPRQGDAVVMPDGLGLRDTLAKIALGHEEAAAIFGDEGVAILQFSADELDFHARPAASKDQRRLPAVQFLERLLRAAFG